MKIAIATPAQVRAAKGEQPRWVSLYTDYLRPSEIRRRIDDFLVAEEEGGEEVCIVTMNRTVLDMVTHPEVKTAGPISYEDVVIWSDEAEDLVPLLSLHSEDWLVHFALGDVINREL